MASDDNKAGVVGLIFSFLFPIVGVILYFVKKDSVVNPSAYLASAGAGFCVGIVLRLLAAAGA